MSASLMELTLSMVLFLTFSDAISWPGFHMESLASQSLQVVPSWHHVSPCPSSGMNIGPWDPCWCR